MNSFETPLPRGETASSRRRGGRAEGRGTRPIDGQALPTNGAAEKPSADPALAIAVVLAMVFTVLVAVLVLGASAARAADDGFLDPTDAFRSEIRAGDDGRSFVIAWKVAPGYHLYGERLSITPANPNIALEPVQRPAGERAWDPVLEQNTEKLGGAFEMRVPVRNSPAQFEVDVSSQGCADAGLCYPPQTQRISVSLPAAIAGTAATDASTDWSEAGIGAALASGNVLRVASLFLLLGLLLAFTPCVLPMVPILSSIIVGQGHVVTRSRGLALSVAYSLGMALVYTALGIGAGLAGEGLAATLQHPAVLTGFALLLVLLALSMFDVYQLQLPASWQGKVSDASARLPGGKFASVFAMGAMSALIVGPCVAAPLAGALLYISRSRDVVLGGTALFSMACGMSVPLLLTGLSAGSLLPRAGVWMNGVKHFFGSLLIAVALWMLTPVLPTWLLMLSWAAFAIAIASWLRVFDPLPEQAHGARRMAKALGVLAFVLGTLELAGVAIGADDPLRPLAPLAAARAAIPAASGTISASGSTGSGTAAASDHRSAHAGTPAFDPISNVAELERELAGADRPVVLDFYADWCVSCKEMERFTFTDGTVRERLQAFRLLRVDVTRNDDASRALMRRFELFGPPGLVFLHPQHGEIAGTRVVGYRKAPDLVPLLDKVASAGR